MFTTAQMMIDLFTVTISHVLKQNKNQSKSVQMIHFNIDRHIVSFILKFTKLYNISLLSVFLFSQIIYIGQNTVRAIIYRSC